MAESSFYMNTKACKKDEIYTYYEDIMKEVKFHKNIFAGKTVFCNCNDLFDGGFCRFFLENFSYLKLKRLICTSYSPFPEDFLQLSLFDILDEPVQRVPAYVLDTADIPKDKERDYRNQNLYHLMPKKIILIEINFYLLFIQKIQLFLKILIY